MPSIEEEIAAWLNLRSDWVRILAAEVLRAGHVDKPFAHKLAVDLIGNRPLGTLENLTAKHLPNSTSTGARVELASIGNLKNVNALADNSTLTFGDDGLTVIYGDNGSGKSGFARLVKDVVGARHRQDILPNAFDPAAAKTQSATITYRVDGTERALNWPTDVDAELTQIHFYDEACGDQYLVTDTELSYRPSALNVLDELVKAVDLLRDALDDELAKFKKENYEVPGLLPSTAAGKFVASFGHEVTDEEVDAAAKLPEDPDAVLAERVQEEGRLQSTNPSTEKSRLLKVASALVVIADHLDAIQSGLNPDTATKLEVQLRDTRNLRVAADLASKANFIEEPLDGVGSETWRALWSAAEAYSQQEAYHEHAFPHMGEGARCPLCQQELNDEAVDRLTRFQAFVHDETAKKASAAEALMRAAIKKLTDIQVATVATTNALAAIETEDPALVENLRTVFENADAARARIGERLRGETTEPALPLTATDTDGLRIRSSLVRERSEKIDSAAFATQLKAATDAKNELKDAMELAKHVANLKQDAARQRAIKDITAIRSTISTQPITKQAISLTRIYVNEQVNDRFSRESDRLGLEHVKLDDKGGGKARLRHKPALLGATLATKTVRDVLSEGEQTALGLAGLLTEINFDESESALVLDDPITSLDHGRREKVARRIAKLAGKRQVVVFTHDLTFLGDLIRATDEEGVALREHSIVKDSRGVPGTVLDTHPWKAKDAKKRIGDLREELARLKKEQPALTLEDFGNRVQLWAGKLSETWERIVRNDVVGKVVDRGTTEVRPKMVKLLAQITPADNTDFQSGYGQVTKWAPRHDKSEEINFVPPTVEELAAELDRIDAWYKRIVSYA
ncbi:energy-coupling factor transporter ATP-binding protein EcfA2 [Microbacterium sp. SORGH_AS 1204]|uniref:AAA family ATPase n=1 Tax=Microbacterium sp. SORGH_AS_1204 TaxID=3041785 RepID=UPI0027939C95|nr:AAA family ATPase [Microbacterium sp. SORGH_AS_1204]MDQ1136151.1 energy-coupling factor transporter ATP-binding protein EcfA2 [Microbacterium sp. SORGH_AS_1204]